LNQYKIYATLQFFFSLRKHNDGNHIYIYGREKVSGIVYYVYSLFPFFSSILLKQP